MIREFDAAERSLPIRTAWTAILMLGTVSAGGTISSLRYPTMHLCQEARSSALVGRTIEEAAMDVEMQGEGSRVGSTAGTPAIRRGHHKTTQRGATLSAASDSLGWRAILA